MISKRGSKECLGYYAVCKSWAESTFISLTFIRKIAVNFVFLFFFKRAQNRKRTVLIWVWNICTNPLCKTVVSQAEVSVLFCLYLYSCEGFCLLDPVSWAESLISFSGSMLTQVVLCAQCPRGFSSSHLHDVCNFFSLGVSPLVFPVFQSHTALPPLWGGVCSHFICLFFCLVADPSESSGGADEVTPWSPKQAASRRDQRQAENHWWIIRVSVSAYFNSISVFICILFITR